MRKAFIAIAAFLVTLTIMLGLTYPPLWWIAIFTFPIVLHLPIQNSERR